MADLEEEAGTKATTESPASAAKEKGEQREIKGGLPYTTSPGVLKKALELAITAERPDKFSTNYMGTVLQLTGGSARAVPPFLKKMHFIGGDGAPTALYSKFKTDGGRSQAAYEGLKAAFGELFRRNEYIHKADEGTVKDVIVEITGLRKTDPIVRYIYASFDAVRSFVSGDVSAASEGTKADHSGDQSSGAKPADDQSSRSASIGLSYQINIVLPETDNIAVFNSIFKSLRDNLLR